MNLNEEMERDAARATPSTKELKDLSTLLDRRGRLLAQLAEAEERVKSLKQTLHEIESKDIPELMIAAGVAKFVTADGRAVSYSTAYFGRADSLDAVEWLKKNGHGDILKDEFRVGFAAGEAESAGALKTLLQSHGYEFEEKEYVHPSTMKAWLREQIEAGASIPLDLFSVHSEYITKVKG